MVRHARRGRHQADDLAHTVIALAAMSSGFHAPPNTGDCTSGDLHAGRANVDTVDCGPLPLPVIERLAGRADQLEIFR